MLFVCIAYIKYYNTDITDMYWDSRKFNSEFALKASLHDAAFLSISIRKQGKFKP